MKRIILLLFTIIFVISSQSILVLAASPVDKKTAEENQNIKLLAPIGEEKEFKVPEYEAGKAGYSIRIIEAYLELIYPYAAVVIASLTVLMTGVGALEIVTAGGDPGKVTTGRDRIMYAIAGLILFLLASVILWTINPNFFTW